MSNWSPGSYWLEVQVPDTGGGITEAEAIALIESYNYVTIGDVLALNYVTMADVLALNYITLADVLALNYITLADVLALGYIEEDEVLPLIKQNGYQPEHPPSSSIVTVYVSATGNDTTGDGTSGNPYLTLRRAQMDLAQFPISTNVIIVGAGSFDVSGFWPTCGVTVQGTLTASTTATIFSVTQAGSSTATVVVVTGLNVLSNALIGTEIKYTSGPANNIYGIIHGNTATNAGNTTLYISHGQGSVSYTAPVATNTLQLQTLATTLTGQASYRGGGITIQDCILSGSNANLLGVSPATAMTFSRCKFTGLGAVNHTGGNITFVTSYIATTGNSLRGMMRSSGGMVTFSSGCVIDGTNAGTNNYMLFQRNTTIDWAGNTVFRGIRGIRLEGCDSQIGTPGTFNTAIFENKDISNTNAWLINTAASGSSIGGKMDLPHSFGQTSGNWAVDARMNAVVRLGSSSSLVAAQGTNAVTVDGAVASAWEPEGTIIYNGTPAQNADDIVTSTELAADLANYLLITNIPNYVGTGLEYVGSKIQVDTGDGLVFDGNALEVSLGTGLEFNAGAVRADLGNGLTISGNEIVANLGNGLTFSGSAIAANLGTGLEFNGSAIRADIGNGLTISGNDIVASIGNGLTFSGSTIVASLGTGLEFNAGAIRADLGNGLTLSGNDITANLGNGLTFVGSTIAANLSTGLEFSGTAIRVDIGAGLAFSLNEIVANVGNGLEIVGGVINVKTTSPFLFTGTTLYLDYGDGLYLDGTSLAVNFGNGIQSLGGQISANIGTGLEFSGQTIVVDTDVIASKAYVDAMPIYPYGYLTGFRNNWSSGTPNQITINLGGARSDDNTTDITTTGNVVLDLSDSGINGIDTGVAAVDTVYWIWMVKNTATNAVGAIASLSATSPTMPAGYTKKVIVGFVWTDPVTATAAREFYMQGDGKSVEISFPGQLVSNTATNTESTLSVTKIAPNTTRCPDVFVSVRASAAVAGQAASVLRATGTTPYFTTEVNNTGGVSGWMRRGTSTIVAKSTSASLTTTVKIHATKLIRGGL